MSRLERQWKLACDPANEGREQRWFDNVRPDAKDAPVPGVIQQVFPAYHGVAWYWHTFTPPRAAQPNEQYILRFGAVDYLAEVWLNGAYLGGYEGGETPFEFDATHAIREDDENLLAVRVLNPAHERIDGYVLKEVPSRNKEVPPRCGAAFNSGGIMYPVELLLVPAVRITDVFARPNVKTGRIAVTVTVQNNLDPTSSASITLDVAPATGGDVTQSTALKADLPPGQSQHELTLTVPQPRLWELDDPFLYRLTASLTTTNAPPHQHTVRCGFRDFRVVNGWFHLNGKRLFLRSTHTTNCMPIGQQVAVIPDHVRRDMINAKASGFNMVRFIAGVAYPEQLDFCDEIGLMVYEECFAAWHLEDSPEMAERFDRSTAAMVRRDRNHPSVTIWGLLNETRDGQVFQHAVHFLPKLRKLDDTRLVLLGSGRWDCRTSIGSVSNPGSVEWEPVWGNDGADANLQTSDEDYTPGGYFREVGDAHVYPEVPHEPHTTEFLRHLGHKDKPVFLSEYGIGSLMNVTQEWRHFEQLGAHPDLEDASLLRDQSEALYADWKRLGFDNVYPFPEDLLRESQCLHSRQRTIGFDLIRANPRLVGYNLTGMLDQGITGEGLWTYWRHWKPGTFDAVSDGWSALRWCLFVEPLHGYADRPITVEAVLANEDILPPGEYPARFRLFGPNGAMWEKSAYVTIPEPGPDGHGTLATPVLREEILLDGPAGEYIFAANFERGGAPSGGRLPFRLSDQAALPRLNGSAILWGLDETAQQWLSSRGLHCRQFTDRAPRTRELILVGKPPTSPEQLRQWKKLARLMARGATVIFLSPKAFKRGDDATQMLPLKNKGRCYTFSDWLYHKECVSKRHPVFEGLQNPGIMDWDYYGPLIPHEVFEGLDTPDETIAAAFATGSPLYPRGYGSSLLIAMYRFGQGRFILNTPYILENLDVHPAADRLLLNLIRYGQQHATGPLAPLPANFNELLRSIQYMP